LGTEAELSYHQLVLERRSLKRQELKNLIIRKKKLFIQPMLIQAKIREEAQAISLAETSM
jgi:hypothetical protein